MVRVGCVVAATLVAASVMSVAPAVAEPDEMGAAATHFLLFSGADLWRQGAFLHGGTLWAPNSFDAPDGVVVKLMTVKGLYRYRSGSLGNAEVLGLMAQATLMPGLHFTRGPLTATIYAGADYQLHYLIPDDPGNAARGWHLGLRGAVEFWFQATPHFAVSGSATATTIAMAYAARLALGWRVANDVFLGPEVQLYGADDYRQFRVGLHVTGLRYKGFEWQGAVGYATDSDDCAGVYARLGLARKL